MNKQLIISFIKRASNKIITVQKNKYKDILRKQIEEKRHIQIKLTLSDNKKDMCKKMKEDNQPIKKKIICKADVQKSTAKVIAILTINSMSRIVINTPMEAFIREQLLITRFYC